MNVPKLRFKEFTDEWIEYVLQSESDVRDGTHDSPKYVEKGYPLITSKNLTDMGTLDFSNVSYLKQDDFDKINQRSKVDIGDILFGMIGTIGKPVRIVRDDFAIKNVALIKEKGLIKNDYLIHYLHTPTINKQFANNQDGGTQKFIALDKIRKLKIKMPSRKEQEKIVSLFNLLDKKIELQSKKIEDLKLFTKKTSINLINNITKNLEDVFVEEICKIQTGKSNTQDKNENGQYPFYIRSEDVTFSDKYIFDCEAVLTIGDGNIGKVYFYHNGKFDCHQRVYVMNNFDKSILGKYFYYYFSNNFYKRAMSMSAKNTVDSVRMEMISKMKIRIPTIQEQQLIINVLTNLDNKILLENNKLNKLIELKKGLMQNMFA